MIQLVWAMALVSITAFSVLTEARANSLEDTTSLVEKSYRNIQKLAKEAGTREQLSQQITGTLDTLISWSSFATKTLSKPTWKELTPAQQETFKAAYRTLIVLRYSKRFKPGASFRAEIRAASEKNGVRSVQTTVYSEEGNKKLGVDVDYEFWPGPKGHRVADIVTDGVSRALSYRPKFKRILKKRGFESLIKAIEKNARKK